MKSFRKEKIGHNEKLPELGQQKIVGQKNSVHANVSGIRKAIRPNSHINSMLSKMYPVEGIFKKSKTKPFLYSLYIYFIKKRDTRDTVSNHGGFRAIYPMQNPIHIRYIRCIHLKIDNYVN